MREIILLGEVIIIVKESIDLFSCISVVHIKSRLSLKKMHQSKLIQLVQLCKFKE